MSGRPLTYTAFVVIVKCTWWRPHSRAATRPNSVDTLHPAAKDSVELKTMHPRELSRVLGHRPLPMFVRSAQQRICLIAMRSFRSRRTHMVAKPHANLCAGRGWGMGGAIIPRLTDPSWFAVAWAMVTSDEHWKTVGTRPTLNIFMSLIREAKRETQVWHRRRHNMVLL